MPSPGEFYSLYLLRRAQGHGFGRALMATMAADLLDQGFGSAHLWMLNGNHPAAGFYAALGGRIVHTRGFSEGDWHGTDTAYAWDDLTRLLPAPPGHAASTGDNPPRLR